MQIDPLLSASLGHGNRCTPLIKSRDSFSFFLFFFFVVLGVWTAFLVSPLTVSASIVIRVAKTAFSSGFFLFFLIKKVREVGFYLYVGEKVV